jgi:prolycopene isomerase
MDFDIIVIGAGLGGLTAAACATKEGKRVLVLERNLTPGGSATSFTRGRFEFDASLHSLCGYSNTQGVGDVRIIFDELGISNKIEWCKLPTAFRVITKSKNGEKIDATLPFGIENFIKTMEEYVPESSASLEKLFDVAEVTVDGINHLCATEERINMNFAKSLLKEFGNFVRTAPYTVNEVFSALNIPQRAREILSNLWIFHGVDCDRLSFTEYILTLYNYIQFGGYVPKNRSNEIALTLAGFIEDNGSQIWLGSEVARIIFENNKATGVILSNGEKILCKHIIANCSPTFAYSKMMKVSDVPVTATKRSNMRTFGARGAAIYVGLNRSINDLGITDCNTIITESADSSVQYDLMRTLSSNNMCRVTCLNAINPEASPKGTAILMFTTLFTENCWANIDPENYFEEKDAFAKRIIKLYEDSTGIKISESIEELEIATPLTFARYLNTPQGVIYGYSTDNKDNMLSRFMTEESDSDTKGLRFCGGFGTQGAGVHSAIASGRNTCYATLYDIEKEDKGDKK